MKKFTLILGIILIATQVFANTSVIVAKRDIYLAIINNGKIEFDCVTKKEKGIRKDCSYSLGITEKYMVLNTESQVEGLPNSFRIPLEHGTICRRIDFGLCVYSNKTMFTKKCPSIVEKKVGEVCNTRMKYIESDNEASHLRLHINHAKIAPILPEKVIEEFSLFKEENRIYINISFIDSESKKTKLYLSEAPR